MSDIGQFDCTEWSLRLTCSSIMYSRAELNSCSIRAWFEFLWFMSCDVTVNQNQLTFVATVILRLGNCDCDTATVILRM